MGNLIKPDAVPWVVHRLGPRLDEVERAIVVGLGGGGDVCGTLPTRQLLDAHGVDCVVGGAAWQRTPHDPSPGPRPIDDFEHVDRLGSTTALAGPATRTRDGVRYAEAMVADILGEDTLLVDITDGAAGVADGLEAAADALDADLVVGVDVGGDLLGVGDEPGLRSPLCDSVAGAGIASLERSLLASFGLCADGELTLDEVHARLEAVRDAGAYLGAFPLPREAAEAMRRCLAFVPSEASRVPLMAFEGRRGPVEIRHGTAEAVCHDGSTLTHYLDPEPFAADSPLVGAVAGTGSLLAANDALHDLGVTQTELDVETVMEERGLDDYGDVPRDG